MLTIRRPFRLDKPNGKVMGVCAGLANYFGVDTVWFRVGFLAAAVIGFGSPVIIYLIIGLVADSRPA
jgi:phage shock protein PspC (stress-responsive transcriptional regulator)